MSYKVKLEIFEGPLDLLLYLVKQSRLEIDAIPIAQITDQYLKYLELMQALDLEVAGEFLVVAATLMQIKSRMLLPPEAVPPSEEEPDPAMELLERLKEYQKFKQAADLLSGMEKERLTVFSRPNPREGVPVETEEFVEASLFDLLTAFSQFMAGTAISRDLIHEVLKEEVTVEQRAALLRSLVLQREQVSFGELFHGAKSKMEAVATFLALLELIRLGEISIRQNQLFGEIVLVANSQGRQIHHG